VSVPHDLRSYFLGVDGMGERGAVFDDDFFSFWRLRDVRSVADERPDTPRRLADASNYFLFADHSLFLPAFAIRLHEDVGSRNVIARVYTDIETSRAGTRSQSN
jgi:hypothetical protein